MAIKDNRDRWAAIAAQKAAYTGQDPEALQRFWQARYAAQKAGRPIPPEPPRVNAPTLKAKQPPGKLQDVLKPVKVSPTRAKRNRDIQWSGDSDCFDDLFFDSEAGEVIATFANPTRGDWTYPMSYQEAREWLIENGDAPGTYFNDQIRE